MTEFLHNPWFSLFNNIYIIWCIVGYNYFILWREPKLNKQIKQLEAGINEIAKAGSYKAWHDKAIVDLEIFCKEQLK